MEEIWKEIKGWEGYYEISNFGNVRSLSRSVMRNGMHLSIPGKALKPYITTAGYEQVNFCKNSIKRPRAVHRLVAGAFIPNPNNKPQVNHIDGIKKNNNDSNLEWATSSENNSHSVHVLNNYSYLKAAAVASIKLRKPIIGTHSKTGEKLYFASQKEAGVFFNHGTSTIWRALYGKLKTAYNYKWEFQSSISAKSETVGL